MSKKKNSGGIIIVLFVSHKDTIRYNIIILCISLERCGCSKTTVWRINTQRPRHLGCCCDDIVVERFSFETNQRNTIRLIKIRDMNVSSKSSDFFFFFARLYVFFLLFYFQPCTTYVYALRDYS